MRRLAAALLFCALPAAAHQTSVSFSELDVHDAAVDGTLRFALADLRPQLAVDPKNLDAASLSRLLLEPFVLKTSGQACALQPGVQVAADGDDGIALTARWLCPVSIEALSVRVGFLDQFPSGAAHLSRIRFGEGAVSQRVAQAEEPSFEVRYERSVKAEFFRFLRLGIEHIFTGYDHICFLIGLLLLGGSLRRLIGIVTAFTVAHSITLALAALNLLSPSPRIVEPLIAASIVFVGLEDLWALRAARAESALRHRWMITFAFGLVHGFGFASVLRELQLPRAVLATGLVSFNLGVETGQICIVIVALPLLRKLRTFKSFAPIAACCVAALGAFWLMQRLFFGG
ncbi:MAG TPA: HupE/UreJ family protein [Myxococcales bacterium]|nr:HupE/UreJ family protein [Myxococcales bacterium]